MNPPSQNNLAMSPLPSKNELSASQPVIAVWFSPAGLAQIIVTSLTIKSGGVAPAAFMAKRANVAIMNKTVKSLKYFKFAPNPRGHGDTIEANCTLWTIHAKLGL